MSLILISVAVASLTHAVAACAPSFSCSGVQQIAQAFAGAMNLRFRAGNRASDQLGNFAMAIAENIVQHEEPLVVRRQLADGPRQVQALHGAQHGEIAGSVLARSVEIA